VATDAGFSVTVDFVGSAVPEVPDVTVIVGAVDVRAVPSIVAFTVLLPAVVPAVNVAVDRQSVVSGTGPDVPVGGPVPRLNTTADPHVINCAPAASRAVKVTVDARPVATDAGLSVTVDFDGSAVPEVPDVTVIVGAVEVRAVPSIVALIVLLPAVVPAVNVA